jgi:hypothetical protein
MPEDAFERILGEMTRNIRRDIAGGFDSPDEIVRVAVEVFSEKHNPALVGFHAARLTRESLAQHLAAQAQWPQVTDCDLLDAAFAELDRAGVIARQNFSCCGT